MSPEDKIEHCWDKSCYENAHKMVVAILNMFRSMSSVKPNIQTCIMLCRLISQNNVNAHYLPPALFKLFDEQTMLNINSKIIERVYIFALPIFSVNVVSILSTFEEVFSHMFLCSIKKKWNYDCLKDFNIQYFKIYTRFAITDFNLHLINQNKFQYVFDPLLHSSQTA